MESSLSVMKPTRKSFQDSIYRAKSAILEGGFISEFHKTEASSEQKIQEYFFQILKQVNKLDSWMQQALRQHEQDYLKAFKCQMHKICSQLHQLRQKADQNQLKIKKDEELNRMKYSLNWFRDQAVKLRETSHFYKKEAQKWKTQSESLEEDKKYLEKLLTNAKIQIKQILLKKDPGKKSQTEKSFSKTQFIQKTKSYVPNTQQGLVIIDILKKFPSHIQFLSQIEKYMTKKEKWYIQNIKNLKLQLQTAKNKENQIFKQKNSNNIPKNQLEEIFVSCIEQVRRDLQRRRAKSIMQRNLKTRRLSVSYQKQEQLSFVDKKKILELLVSNQKVLLVLYQMLFPQKLIQNTPQAKISELVVDQSPISNIDQLVSQVKIKGIRRKFPKHRRSIS